jgi:hypothetical protein
MLDSKISKKYRHYIPFALFTAIGLASLGWLDFSYRNKIQPIEFLFNTPKSTVVRWIWDYKSRTPNNIEKNIFLEEDIENMTLAEQAARLATKFGVRKEWKFAHSIKRFDDQGIVRVIIPDNVDRVELQGFLEKELNHHVEISGEQGVSTITVSREWMENNPLLEKGEKPHF